MQSYSSEILVFEFQRGNLSSFRFIFNLLFSEVYFVAKSFIPDEELAKTCTIDSFARLWKKRRQFDSIDSMKEFLVENCCASQKPSDFDMECGH